MLFGSWLFSLTQSPSDYESGGPENAIVFAQALVYYNILHAYGWSLGRVAAVAKIRVSEHYNYYI